MALRSTIDSNEFRYSIAREISPGVVDSTVTWLPIDINAANDLGPNIRTVERETISQGRVRQKGVAVGIDVNGGYDFDVTLDDTTFLMLSSMYLNTLRDKNDTSVAVTTTSEYQPAAGGDSFVANDLIFAKNFDDVATNGLKTVTGTPTATSVPVSETIVAGTGQVGIISRVGYAFASGDAGFDSTSQDLPRLTTTTKDLTTLGLNVGEWVYVGDPTTVGNRFDTAGTNGWYRIFRITANYLEFDNTRNASPLADDAGVGKTIRIWFGRVAKNETLQSRSTFQIEAVMGNPDFAVVTPDPEQAMYIVGGLPGEFQFNMDAQDIIRSTMSFLFQDVEVQLQGTPLKAGTRQAASPGDALNTTNDVGFLSVGEPDNTSPFTTELYECYQQFNWSINNNLTGNTAITVFGNKSVTAGQFDVNIEATSYFQTPRAITLVRTNADLQATMGLIRGNKGYILDCPVVTAGGALPEPSPGAPVTSSITLRGSTGSRYDTQMDHTMLVSFFDYLPTGTSPNVNQ